MGSQNFIKKVRQPLLGDVIATAVEKFPGYKKEIAMLQYYNILVKIVSKKPKSALRYDLHLLTLIMNGLEYFYTDGRN